MHRQTRDLTEGRPLPLLVSFSLPLMVGNVFQQMYTVVDTAVVGKALGVGALAALGASDWLNWMMLGVIQGLTQGFGIMMAQDFGSRQMDRLRRTIGASAVLSAIGALVLLAVGQVAIAPILRLLQTPDAIQGDTVLYLRIMFGGVPVVMAYNLFAGMIRSLGDSKTPLYAMMVASCVNIGLDLLFVLVFHWGIAGAAAATLIAQVFAAGFCLWHLGKLPVLKMKREDFRLDWSQAGQLLQLGFPMAFQNAIISVGGMIVQSVVNGFGMIFIAGFTATNKLYGLLEAAAVSFGYAITTYTGQNLGARKFDRVKKVTYIALALAFVMALLNCAVCVFAPTVVFRAFSSDPAVIEAGVPFMHISVITFLLSDWQGPYNGVVTGSGHAKLSFVIGMLDGVVLRIGISLFLANVMGMGVYGYYYGNALARLAPCVICTWYFYSGRWAKRKLLSEA